LYLTPVLLTLLVFNSRLPVFNKETTYLLTYN